MPPTLREDRHECAGVTPLAQCPWIVPEEVCQNCMVSSLLLSVAFWKHYLKNATWELFGRL